VGNANRQIFLLVNINQAVFTNTLIVAKGVGLEHKNIIALVRKYKTDFEEFERVAFQTRPFMTKGGMQEMEIVELTEDQATYLITLFKNTEIVRKFKIWPGNTGFFVPGGRAVGV
jgi:phage regulator Rha-like protein